MSRNTQFVLCFIAMFAGVAALYSFNDLGSMGDPAKPERIKQATKDCPSLKVDLDHYWKTDGRVITNEQLDKMELLCSIREGAKNNSADSKLAQEQRSASQ